SQHRIFGVEHRVLRRACPRVERPVVADLRRAVWTRVRGSAVTEGTGAIQAPAAVLVVGLPRRIGRLNHDVGLTRVIANDEDDVTRAAGVGASQLGDVNARYRTVRRPRCGYEP